MNEYIDIYCERLNPGLWAEPLNAVTNASFIIAGIFALMLARQERALNWRSGSLIALIFAIGIGSTLFHTFATFWAMLSDVLPILFFQIVFIALYTNQIIRMHWAKTIGLLALFFIAMQGAMQLPREWLNGSLEYAPALLFVAGLGLYQLKNGVRERYGLLLAAGIFVISVTFRSIDMALCETWPRGTHFLWHSLNGVVLYLSARSYILNAPKL